MRVDVVDPNVVSWKRGETEGLTFNAQVLLDGGDGGPEALRFRFDPTPAVYAHLHLTAQFQVVLSGRMDMPRGIQLQPLDVHYTDHNVPYGPFAVADGHDMLVLHPKSGGLLPTSDEESRLAINREGRLLVGSPRVVDWRPVPGSELRFKPMISDDGGVRVSILECPPRTAVQLGPAPFGRYEVTIAGSMIVSERELVTPGFRYVEGDEAPEPLWSGREGARIMVLTFDADARAGGLTGEGVSIRAGAVMNGAI
jgi:hypothetical protein